MKMFEDTRGFIIAFGWDMVNRVKKPRIISWCDPGTKDWNMAPTNCAGWLELGFDVTPEFIMQSDGKIVAYQPGKCIVMTYVGGIQIWNVETLLADACSAIAA